MRTAAPTPKARSSYSANDEIRRRGCGQRPTVKRHSAQPSAGVGGTATNRGGISNPEFSTNSVGSAMASVSAAFEGSNPAFHGAAPDIEVSTAISITENLKTGQVFISLDLSSKQFPATEGFVQDAAGNAVFLAGAAAYGTAGDLIDADKAKVASVDLVVGINEKGIFQNVTMGGKTYSIEEFNKLGTSQPAGPKPREEAPGE